jgi:transcription initiation factor IIE alpha subunit
MDSTAFEEQVRDLPCDAKLVFVVLEKRGPFTQDEITEETYLSEEESVYALAVLEDRGMVKKHEHGGEDIYEVSRPT